MTVSIAVAKWKNDFCRLRSGGERSVFRWLRINKLGLLFYP